MDLDPPHLVQGSGVVQGTTVRFHEKDVDNNGKDIRVGGREMVQASSLRFQPESTPVVDVRMTVLARGAFPFTVTGRASRREMDYFGPTEGEGGDEGSN